MITCALDPLFYPYILQVWNVIYFAILKQGILSVIGLHNLTLSPSYPAFARSNICGVIMHARLTHKGQSGRTGA